MYLTKIKFFNSFIIFYTFLFCLIPAAQISGPLITEILITFIALSYLILIILNPKKHKNFFFLTILFFFWIFISLVATFSETKHLSIPPSYAFIRFVLFSYAIIYLIKENRLFLKNFNILLIGTIGIIVFDGYFQFFFEENIIGIKSIRPDRLSSFFGDELVIGTYLFKIYPIILFLFFENREIKWIKISNIFLIILIPILILLSGERAAFILNILFLGLVSLLFFNKKKIIFFITCLILIFGTILFSNKVIYDRYIIQMKNHIIVQDNYGTIIMPEHIGLFNSAYDIFKKNKIYGGGIKSFRELCKKNKSKFKKKIRERKLNFCSTHPHNYYLQFLAELGIIGFMFILGTFLYCSYLYFRLLRKKIIFKSLSNVEKKYFVMLCGIITQIWPFSTHGNFFNNWNLSLLFLNFCLFFFLYLEKKAIQIQK